MVALALAITSVTVAANVPSDNEKNPTTEQQIGSLLANPNLDISADESAYVTFMVNKKHEIVVLSVETSSEQVETFVKKRLNYQKISEELISGRTYAVPVSIHYEL